MMTIGRVSALVRYPVKSMAGIPVRSAILGWYGLAGDRRFAFERPGDASGMPWLTASRMPELLLYQPTGLNENDTEPLPTHVRTPAGLEPGLGSVELENEIASRFGKPVRLMKLRHGIFDESPVSIIAVPTMAAIGRDAGLDVDERRFRPNIVVETESGEPFLEDRWVGGVLVFGDPEPQPAVSVTMRDERCVMVNFDPATAARDPRVMKAIVRLNNNTAGVYATVLRTGTIRVGDRVSLA